MKTIGLFAILACCFATAFSAETLPPLTNGAPQTVESLWAGFDPRAEPLEVEILHAYEQDGVTLQVLRYRVGVFNSETAMVAAVYGYPTGQTNLPALLNIHGGGQFATANACYRNAQHGYATLSVAWDGRINAQDYWVNNAIRDIYLSGDTNHPNYKVTTDWVGLDQGGGVESREGSYDDLASPRNSSWFLWTMAARRGLTFLEQQAEVDGDRLGVYGHSMGGKLTVLTAGSDERLKAAAPSCGGVSDIFDRNALYRTTIGDSNYLDRVSCPIFFLSPANDFHGRIDDVPQAISQVSSNEWRVTHAPHHNHQDTAKYTVPTLIWMDQYLKSGMPVPASPEIQLTLNPGSGVPMVTVIADTNRTIHSVEVYYTQQGLDSGEVLPSIWDATYRFWHYAATQDAGGTWTADIPVYSTSEPLWVYANITYALDAPITGADYYYNDYTAEEVVLSSMMEKVSSSALQAAGVTPTLSLTNLIEDFQGDWKKAWFNYSNDSNDWAVTTHKINDPVYASPALAKLSLEVKSADANTLLLTMNDDATVSVPLTGGTAWQTLVLFPMEFQKDGSAWGNDFSAGKRLRLSKGSASWSGTDPEFRNLRWVQATQEEYDAFEPVGEYVQRNTSANTWTDWNINGWYSERSVVRLPEANDWARIHYNRHTVLGDAKAVARLDMFWNSGANLRIDNGGSLTVSAAGGFDGSINLSGAGHSSGSPNVGVISIESGGNLLSGNTGSRTVLNGDASQRGSLILNGGTFTARGRSATNYLELANCEIRLNSGTFDMTGGQARPNGVVFKINGEGSDIDFWLLNSALAASDYHFVLGADGVSPVDVSGWAHLSLASMVVDGSRYTGGATKFTLFATSGLASTMNPANITVTNFPEWARVTVEQDAVTTQDVILHITGEPPPPPIEKILYFHDFEDGTTDGMAIELLSSSEADAALSSTIGDQFGNIYANFSYTKTLTNAFSIGTTYTVGLDHFRRKTTSGDALKMEIGYDDGGGFTALKSETFPAVTDITTLINRSVSWEAKAGAAELGHLVAFRLTDGDASGHVSGNQAAYDNMVLKASTPGSLPLGAFNLGGMANGEITFLLDTHVGQIYNVITNADLRTPNWGLAGSFVGDGDIMSVTHIADGAQLFYQLTSP